MNLTKKQSIAQLAIASISRHFDATVAEVHAELDTLSAFITTEKAKFTAKKAELTKPKE
jgi:hypothetical protein